MYNNRFEKYTERTKYNILYYPLHYIYSKCYIAIHLKILNNLPVRKIILITIK